MHTTNDTTDTAASDTTAAAPTEQLHRVLLTVEDAAALLSISRTRVYALIKAGDITSVRVGRLRRIPAAALDTFTNRLLAQQHAA